MQNYFSREINRLFEKPAIFGERNRLVADFKICNLHLRHDGIVSEAHRIEIIETIDSSKAKHAVAQLAISIAVEFISLQAVAELKLSIDFFFRIEFRKTFV